MKTKNKSNFQKEGFLQILSTFTKVVKDSTLSHFNELIQIQAAITNYLKFHREKNSDSTSIFMQTPEKNKSNKIGSYSYAMSDIKTSQEYEQLSRQNELMMKQLEQIIQNYQRQKITLNNQAQNILNVWLEAHPTPQSPMIQIFKDIIQQLSKHMSVQQYINNIQSLQSHLTISQMNKVEPNNESLIFKQAKKYVIQMAKIIYEDQNEEDQISFNDIKFQ